MRESEQSNGQRRPAGQQKAEPCARSAWRPADPMLMRCGKIALQCSSQMHTSWRTAWRGPLQVLAQHTSNTSVCLGAGLPRRSVGLRISHHNA